MTKGGFKVTKTKQNSLSELSGLFEQLLDEDKMVNNPTTFYIILDKFKEYKVQIHKFLSLLLNLNSQFIDSGYIIQGLKETTDRIFKSYKRYSIELDVDKYFSFEEIPVNTVTKIRETYFGLVGSEIIQTIIKMGSNILRGKIKKFNYEEYRIRCKNKLATLNIMEDIDYTINKKDVSTDVIVINDIAEFFDEKDSKEIFEMLLSIVGVCKNLLNLYNTPDIDTDKIFESIMTVFDKIKNDMRGCEGGLNIIMKSKELFKNNFNKYYKQIKKTGNPNVLISDFITDVVEDNSSNTDISMKDINEVKKVALYFKKFINTKMKQSGRSMPNKFKNMIDKIDVVFDKFMKDDFAESSDNLEEIKGDFTDIFNLQAP